MPVVSKNNYPKILIFSLISICLLVKTSAQPPGSPQKMSVFANGKYPDTLAKGAALPPHFYAYDPFELWKAGPSAKFDPVYDMRQTPWLSPVKSQSADGCWAYATMGAIESRWLTLGYPVFDLSDNNMKYCHQYVPERSYWGNHWMATSYLVRGGGPFTEAQDPYPGGTPGPGECPEGLVPQAYIPEARYLPKNMNLIKQTVLDYGAITSMMYISNAYYNPVNFTYYYPGSSINHVVCIVGWNDTITTAGGTGAWICRNSYGPGWGQGGYFYVSYNDGAFTRYNSYWPERWDYDELATIYQHDMIGGYDGVGWGDSLCYALVKFQAETDLEILHIGTFIFNSGLKTTFKIFDDIAGAPTGLLGQKNWTSFDLPGYYTISLDSSIKIAAGNEFYILAGFNSRTLANKWPIPVEDTIDGYAEPMIESGKCWINPNFELYPSYWFPLGADQPGWEYDICLKLYTKPLHSVTGAVAYHDSLSTPLPNQAIKLFGAGNYPVDSTQSDPGGAFEFPLLPQGQYYLDADIDLQPGGYNATDALLAQLHSVSMPGFELYGLPFHAGDVNNDDVVNATDALYILQRTVELITEFPAADWQTQPDTLEIHGSNMESEIWIQCTGDINSSYFRTENLKNQLKQSDKRVMDYSTDDEFSLPVLFAGETNLAAYSISLKTTGKELRILNVESSAGMIQWNKQQGVLMIAGIISENTEFGEGDTLLVIQMTASRPLASIPFEMSDCELVNSKLEPLQNILAIPSLRFKQTETDKMPVALE